VATNEEIQQIEDQFFATIRGAAAYDTDETRDRLFSYIMSAFPESVLSVAAWEIAFKSCKLKKIAGWVPPVTDEQRQLVDQTPGYLVRERYAKDPEFRAAWDAIEAEEIEMRKNPWLKLTAERYNRMCDQNPNRVGLLLVEDDLFKAAVQRLIDKGEL
jgi:hypothetical protein